jgi:hypothetical protein
MREREGERERKREREREREKERERKRERERVANNTRSHAHEEIPGTVDLRAKEGEETHYGQALFPVPSADPNDPLQVSGRD